MCPRTAAVSNTGWRETSPAWWREAQSELTQVAHPAEYFHSDSANLAPRVSQQTGGQSEEDRRSKLAGMYTSGSSSLTSSFPMTCSLGSVTCGGCVVREASVRPWKEAASPWRQQKAAVCRHVYALLREKKVNKKSSHTVTSNQVGRSHNFCFDIVWYKVIGPNRFSTCCYTKNLYINNWSYD